MTLWHPLTSRPYRKDFFDRETVRDLLLLVGVDCDEFTLASWDARQRMEAGNWALRIHLRASDNNCVRVPPRPAHVPDVRQLNPHARSVMDL